MKGKKIRQKEKYVSKMQGNLNFWLTKIKKLLRQQNDIKDKNAIATFIRFIFMILLPLKNKPKLSPLSLKFF